MEKYKFNNIEYNLIKDYRDGFEEEIVKEKMTDYFNDFDYVVGDISYNILRLKGFKRNSKSNNKYNRIDFLDEYLSKYCSYGAKWFIISKVYKDIK